MDPEHPVFTYCDYSVLSSVLGMGLTSKEDYDSASQAHTYISSLEMTPTISALNVATSLVPAVDLKWS